VNAYPSHINLERITNYFINRYCLFSLYCASLSAIGRPNFSPLAIAYSNALDISLQDNFRFTYKRILPQKRNPAGLFEPIIVTPEKVHSFLLIPQRALKGGRNGDRAAKETEGCPKNQSKLRKILYFPIQMQPTSNYPLTCYGLDVQKYCRCFHKLETIQLATL
jgi:hypothetical protein